MEKKNEEVLIENIALHEENDKSDEALTPEVLCSNGYLFNQPILQKPNPVKEDGLAETGNLIDFDGAVAYGNIREKHIKICKSKVFAPTELTDCNITHPVTNKITGLSQHLDLTKEGANDKLININKIVVDLKNENSCLATEVERYKQNIKEWLQLICQNTQVATSSLRTVYQRDSQEKRELLSEMTSMNEELNRRGETISSLKEVVSMYEKKVFELNSQRDSNISSIKQLRDELTNLQDTSSNTITQLREELHNTSQRLLDLDSQQNVSNDTINQLQGRCRDLEAEVARLKDHTAETDHLSTSTVSRVEESNRLRDVEDSFEDRYYKLRVVAAKLKKRATETQQQLDSDRQKWATERNELIAKLNQLNASARNNQTIQQECDRLGDKLETERMECKRLQKIAADAKVAEASLKATVEEVQTNLEALKINLDLVSKQKDSIAQLLGRKEAELETARKEKVAEELIRDEKAKEVMMLELKLKEEQEKVASLQMDVDSAKMESRKQGVLSLEMQNYEKSLADMSNQLSLERARVGSLEAEIQTLQEIRDSLQEQIRLLEERVSTEEFRSEQGHDQLVETRVALQKAESRVEKLEGTVVKLTDRLERERASAESTALELASLSSAVQTNTDLMLNEKSALSLQVATLSAQLAAVTATLEQTEGELSTVQADFDKYKIRATNVLRKHQSAAVSQAEADANNRADELQALVDTLRAKLDTALCQIEEQTRELVLVNGERDSAESRCVTLNVALTDKCQQLDRTVAEHRSQKLSLDTLISCYKNQLEEKEKALQDQAAEFMEQLEALKRQHNQPLSDLEATNVLKPEPPMIEREDGEGSEYIPDYSPSNSPPRITPNPLLPLDKLLETNDNLHGEREQLESELSTLKAELEHSHKRARHQALLLADTEQDAARKEQLITVLKKEIGHLERCIQREPHAQNTEYLKNVVFKFMTLETVEDRLRLVPVMTTLLQLSPEEGHDLNLIARGKSGESIASWGSYFSTWR